MGIELAVKLDVETGSRGEFVGGDGGKLGQSRILGD